MWLYDTHLDGATIETPDLNGGTGFLYVFDGTVTIQGSETKTVEKGTSGVIRDELLTLRSDGPSDLVFFILDENSKYSRSGRFSG